MPLSILQTTLSLSLSLSLVRGNGVKGVKRKTWRTFENPSDYLGGEIARRGVTLR